MRIRLTLTSRARISNIAPCLKTLAGAEMKFVHSAILSLLSLMCLTVATAKAADKLVVDYGGLSGFQGATWVAKDLKIFDKYGLDVDVIMIGGGARSVATLLSGSTQFGTGSATAPLLATARCSYIKIIAASYHKFSYYFIYTT